MSRSAPNAAIAVALLALSASAAPQPDPPESASADPSAADGTTATDPFAEFLALMREIARAEGRLSDLRKDRHEVMTRLRAEMRRQQNGSVSGGPEDGSRLDRLAARIDAVEQGFAADITDAEQRLRRLEQQRLELDARRP